MPAQLYLIVSPDTDAARLGAVLAAAEVSALLVTRGDTGENAYKAAVKAIIPVAQAAGCAVLIEGDPGLVRMLGADGLHADTTAAAKAATATLKPQLIVGGGNITTRDDAMELGELGVDYVLFGPLSGALAEADRDRAAWWAETMEIPAVLSDPEAAPETLDPLGCEFVALSHSLWNAKEGAEVAIGAFARRLETI